MKNRDRFMNVMNFKKVDDRIPMIEWAHWWDKTLERWRAEGLTSDIGAIETREYLGLDMERHFTLQAKSSDYPVMKHGQGPVIDDASYDYIKKFLYPANEVERIKSRLLELKPLHENGDVVIWISLQGFFWHPRKLFGIENHFYMFHDNPELMHRINSELAAYNIYLIEEFG